MERYVHDPKPCRGRERPARAQIERHPEIFHAAAFRQDLRMTRIMTSRKIQGLLVERRGDDRVDLMRERKIDCAVEGAIRRFPPFRGNLTKDDVRNLGLTAWYDGDHIGPADLGVLTRELRDLIRGNGNDVRANVAQANSLGDDVGVAEDEGTRRRKRERTRFVRRGEKIAPSPRDNLGPYARRVSLRYADDRFVILNSYVFYVFLRHSFFLIERTPPSSSDIVTRGRGVFKFFPIKKASRARNALL